MLLPIVLCLILAGLLFFVGHLCTQHARHLQSEKAPTRKIVPFSLLAIGGNLAAVGMLALMVLMIIGNG